MRRSTRLPSGRASGTQASDARPVCLSGGRGRRVFGAERCGAGRQERRLCGREIGSREIGGFRHFSLSSSLLIVVLLVGLKWSWIDGQARAVVVLSSILETPRLTPTVEAVTGEPRFTEAYVAGNPAFVVKPRGEVPWPVLFFVNGVVTEGRKLPEVRRVAEG